MKRVIGIDFGTSKTVIYLTNKGVLYNEPTVVAIDKSSKKVINAGYLAFKLLGKAPDNISVITPIKNGVIAHGPGATLYLETVLKELKLKKFIKSSTVLVSHPSEISQVEMNALKTVLKTLKFKNIIDGLSKIDDFYFEKIYDSYLHTINRVNYDKDIKGKIREQILALQKEKNVSNYHIYNSLNLNHGNINAFLKNNDTSKLSLETAKRIMYFVRDC